MHELGLVFHVVDTITKLAAENGLTKVSELVLEIGEASSVVPMFIREVYAPACEGTVLEGSKLSIETVPARAKCARCKRMFDPVQFDGHCPMCGRDDIELVSGNEFCIKEILVPE